jgi:fructokinase
MTDTPEVLVVGETLIDFLPDGPGRLASVETFTKRAGGAAANVAIGLSRLDCPPYFLTNVAADGFGDFLIETLEANDVPIDFVTRDSVHETTLAFVSHDADGERTFTFHGSDSADGYLDASAIRSATLDDLSWVCIDAPVALAAPKARGEIIDLCERAREHDCAVAVDPNTRRERWPDQETFEKALERLFSLAHLTKVSVADLEGTSFGASASTSLATNVLEAGPHTVFVTDGANRASVRARERAPWGAVSASRTATDVRTVDTTGAGDAFLAGVLAALTEQPDVKRALEIANRVAGVTTTEAGAIEALPGREALTRTNDG